MSRKTQHRLELSRLELSRLELRLPQPHGGFLGNLSALRVRVLQLHLCDLKNLPLDAPAALQPLLEGSNVQIRNRPQTPAPTLQDHFTLHSLITMPSALLHRHQKAVIVALTRIATSDFPELVTPLSISTKHMKITLPCEILSFDAPFAKKSTLAKVSNRTIAINIPNSRYHPTLQPMRLIVMALQTYQRRFHGIFPPLP